MTRKSVDDDQFGRLHRRLEELSRRVDEGTLSFTVTMGVLQAVIEGKHSPTEPMIFDIVVDYSLTLDQMIKAADFTSVSDSIHMGEFSVVGDGKVKRVVSILHFDERVTNEEILAAMENRGLSPAGIEDLLALALAYPDLQKTHSIVALGSIVQGVYLPALLWDPSPDKKRYLHICMGGQMHDDWIPCWYFAAVRDMEPDE